MRVAFRFLLALLLAWPLAAQATWRRAETASFIGYSRGSEKELRTRLHELQDFDTLLRLVTAVKAPPSEAKLPVFFIAGRDLKILGIADAQVDGIYVSSPGLVYAAVATDRASNSFSNGVNTALFHEYAHHFMFQYFTAAYPPWYVEGYAEYMSTATFKPGETSFGSFDKGRAYQLIALPWMPMQTLLTARRSDLKDAQVPAFYAQSWLTTHYLMRDAQRSKQLIAYLQLVAKGTPRDAAFTTAFGLGIPEFTKALRAYMTSKEFTHSRMTGAAAGPSPGDPVTAMTVLPPSADDLLIPATRLSVIEGRDQAPALLDLVRTAAARYPGDAYAQAVLAEAEIKLGDRAAGLALLDAQLAARPADAQLLYLRGRAWLRDAVIAHRAGKDAGDLMKQARRALAAANRARPDDYRILFAHALASREGRLPDAEMPVLLRAAELAPQVGEIAIVAAQALAARGDKAEARQLLTPVANDPHEGPGSKRAAAMLAALDRNAAVDAGPEETPDGEKDD